MHETSLLLSKGDSFIVPKGAIVKPQNLFPSLNLSLPFVSGNVYRLRNRSKSKEIKLYFILINQPEVEEE